MKIDLYNKFLIIFTIVCSLSLSFVRLLENNFELFFINFLVTFIILIPFLLKKIFKISFDLNTLFLYYNFIFFAHFLGSGLEIYIKTLYYDKFIHFISGFFVSFMALLLMIKIKYYNSKFINFNIIFIVSFVLAIASIWEFSEYILDNLFNFDTQGVLKTGIHDTMQDMICALFGSLLFIFIYIYEMGYQKIDFIKKYVLGVEKNEK